MRRALITGLTVLAVLSMINPAGTAVAQSDNSTAVPSETEIIDENTKLLSATYDEETGEAVITLRSDTIQAITVSDAGAFIKGGVVRQRTVTVKPGDTTTIRMPVTKANGYTGVSIATRKTLYAVPIETSTDMFSGEPTWETAQTAAVGGATGVLLMTAFAAYRLRSGGRERKERVA